MRDRSPIQVLTGRRAQHCLTSVLGSPIQVLTRLSPTRQTKTSFPRARCNIWAFRREHPAGNWCNKVTIGKSWGNKLTITLTLHNMISKRWNQYYLQLSIVIVHTRIVLHTWTLVSSLTSGLWAVQANGVYARQRLIVTLKNNCQSHEAAIPLGSNS